MDNRIPRVNLLGYPVSNLTMDEAIAHIDSFIASGRSHQVVVINANKVYLAGKYPDLRQIIEAAAMVIPEQAMVMAGRWLGTPLKGRVSGVDLMQRLIEASGGKPYRVFLLGGRPDVVKRLCDRCESVYNCRVVGFADGYFSPAEERRRIAHIRRCCPDILFVGLGSPRQERWIYRNRAALNVPVCIGVGGSFDVLVGDKKRAPKWMQHGLEWAYRLMQEPRRLWKRYLITNTVFLWQVVRFRISDFGFRIEKQGLGIGESEQERKRNSDKF